MYLFIFRSQWRMHPRFTFEGSPKRRVNFLYFLLIFKFPVFIYSIIVRFHPCHACRYGLSWNPNLNGNLLSASDDHVSTFLFIHIPLPLSDDNCLMMSVIFSLSETFHILMSVIFRQYVCGMLTPHLKKAEWWTR